MIFRKTDLYEFYSIRKKRGARAELFVYAWENSPEFCENRRRPAILICPGGGYAMCSDREAEAIAFRFFAAGFQAFVLRYSVAPVRHPAQLAEAVLAVDYIRKNAEELKVIPDRIAACGFSAGGHLVGMLATMADAPEVAAYVGERDGKPNACILGYPVITAGIRSDGESIRNLTGKERGNGAFSLERRVSRDTVPSFLWTTAKDGAVPAQNSLLFASALAAAGVDYELHIYQDGPHGLATADEETAVPGMPAYIDPRAATWIPLALSWLKRRGICLEVL